MSDFISREAAIKLFNFAVLDCLGMEPTIRAGDIIKALESIPAADVRPVVRGRWLDGRCTCCGWEMPDEEIYWGCEETTPSRKKYCPNCGAKMEES